MVQAGLRVLRKRKLDQRSEKNAILQCRILKANVKHHDFRGIIAHARVTNEQMAVNSNGTDQN